MNNAIRVMLTFVAALALSVPSLAATEDPPEPGKMKQLKFPDFKEFTTDNGIEVIVVEHHEQPVVSIYAFIKTGDAADPPGKEATAGFVIDQINKGTETRTSLELAEWIESVGGSVGGNSSSDWSAFSVRILSDYLDTAYSYLQDVFLNPVFPEDELEIVRKQAKTGLEFELSDPNAMAQRHLRDLVYGEHPYAKQPTVAAVEAITREDLVDFYNRNYVANNVMIAVVGDVKWKNVRKAINANFAGWQQGTPDVVDYAAAPAGSDSKIFLYNKPGAVQTEVWVGQLGPKADNEDWPAITVANRVLGGGSDARLFMNLREEKGWTYGAYSSFSREVDSGMFSAHAAVRTEVTDSALVELLSELNRIREEPVTAEDLDNAKAYLIGNFPLQVETPDQIAGRVGRNKLRGLSQDQLETYRDRMDEVTVADVQSAMSTYTDPSQSYFVLVGDAGVVADMVEGVAPIETYTIAGEPLDMGSLAVEAVDFEYDTDQLQNHTATYSVVVQEMAIGDLDVKFEKGTEVIAVSSSITGMITMEQTMEFGAANLEPIAYSSMMKMGPQTMGSEFAFTQDAGTGRVQSPGAEEPKEVAFDLVGGTILDGTVEYALAALPLEAGKSFRFPVVDAQSGTLQNIDVDVLELAEITTAAGDFKAYKVKVARPSGDAIMYLSVDMPHILVKQEVPSQALTMELKTLN